jgi:integrase
MGGGRVRLGDPVAGRGVAVSAFDALQLGEVSAVLLALRPRTVELYRWLLRKHIEPHVGGVKLGDLSTAVVREWRSNLLAAGVSQSIAAKSYRLLRAVLTTAVEEDGLLSRNPCRVKGADRESPAERPVLTVAQVFELADAMRFPRFGALILLIAFATLRWGEVTALRRRDIAPDVPGCG